MRAWVDSAVAGRNEVGSLLCAPDNLPDRGSAAIRMPSQHASTTHLPIRTARPLTVATASRPHG